MATLDQSAFVEDSGRAEAVASSFFYTLGDILGGTDTQRRNAAATYSPTDVGAAADGSIYVRGTTRQVSGNTAAANAGMVISPTMILVGLGLYLLWKH
jgi:hypothetical protein